jgi:very-short-patch-repair endonuclease
MRPIRQYVVQVGPKTYRLDFAFPQWRVGVEGVGDSFHRSQLTPRRDHARLADLASASWRIIPVTWADITTTSALVVGRVMRAITGAA